MRKLALTLALALCALAPLAAAGGAAGAQSGDAAVQAAAATSMTVPGSANIFGAGSSPTDPGGGGAGSAPPLFPIKVKAGVVKFGKVTGAVTCCNSAKKDYTGPEGGGGSTNIQGANGISGVGHSGTMVLLGVFLGKKSPLAAGGPGKGFGTPFVIRSGERQVTIPRGATRLYLGFADALGFGGAPGYYGDNAGSFKVPVSVGKAPPEKATLSVDVTPPAGAHVGETVPVKVKVTAGKKKVTAIKLTGLSGGGQIAEVAKKPGGTSGFSLAAGKSKVFEYTVKAKKEGAAALKAAATGKAKKDKVSGDGAGTLRVAKSVLALSIAVTPAPVTLDVTDDGKVVKKKLTVTVKLTNTSTAKIDNVSLQMLNPTPQEKGHRLDQIAVDKGSLPWNAGSIEAQKDATKTFGLEVTGDGKYEFRTLALFADKSAPGGNGKISPTTGKFEVKVPALYFRSTLEDANVSTVGSAKWIKAGKTFFISGKVQNLSSWKHLCLWPLQAKRTGNVGFTGPVDIAIYGRDVPAPPLAGGLKPDESLIWGLWAQTQRLGGTRLTVGFDPKASEVKAGATCDVERVTTLKVLPPTEIKVAKNEQEYVLHVDSRDVQFPPLHAGWRTWNFFGGMVLAPSIALGDFLQETVNSAVEYVSSHSTPEAIALGVVQNNPIMLYGQAWTSAYRNMNKTAQVLSNYWETADASEKKAFTSHLGSVLRRGRDDAWDSAALSVGSVFQTWMDQVEAATANGDNPAVWQALGRTTAKGASRFVIDYAVAELGFRIALKAPALGRTFAEIGDTSVTYKKLKGMPAGKLANLTELRELWGFAASDIKAFRQIAQEEGIVIGIRGRAPSSVQHLDDGAVWKHEAVKPKNVNDVDIKFLGFGKADDSLVAFKRYSKAEEAQIRARIGRAGLGPEELEEVLKRLDTRLGEADEYLAALQQASQKGVIDIGFNYTENGIGRPTSPKPRKFKLLAEQEASGSTTYRPIQQNTLLKKGGKLPKWCREALSEVLCRLTGDMDGVYLATTEGTQLEMKQLMRVYAKLQKAGWQHPETFTWVKEMTGEFWFKAKEKILAGVGPGGQAMAEFGPDGLIRSTYMNLKRSKMIQGNWYVDIVGGYSMMR